MRRKVLVLLLALTLVLSLMPTIAFADAEAEEPASVNETVEEEKIQDEIVVDETEAKNETAVKEENSSIDETAAEEEFADDLSQKEEGTETTSESSVKKKLQKIPGQKALNWCTHPSASRYYVYYYEKDKCKITDRGDKHEVTGEISREEYCKVCGAQTHKEEKLGRTTITEKHYYEGDTCEYCGHKNTCKHTSTYFEYYYDEDECRIIDRGDNNHEVTGKIERDEYCKDCGELLGWKDLTTVTEKHYYFSDGKCEYCGHLNDETRIYGSTRYDTSITAAVRYRSTSGSKFKNIIVADGRNYPDALSGGYLAKVKNAPILLVAPSEEERIATYIKNNIASGGTVYILGGTGAVSASFKKKVEAKGITAKRIGGKDRYETNLKILDAAGVKAEDILVCTGSGYADSLSASAVGKPILLVGDTLTDVQKKYIRGLSTKQFYLIGGKGVVKPAIQTGLKKLGNYNINRLAGSTRYETSTAVAKEFFPKAKTVILAYAKNFPDGLSGGPLAMLKGAPIILIDSGKATAARSYVKSAGANKNYTLGGPAIISVAAVKTVMGK